MFDNSVGHLVAPRIALDALLCHSELLDGVDREPLEIACEVGARYAGDVPADRLRGADRIRHVLALMLAGYIVVLAMFPTFVLSAEQLTVEEAYEIIQGPLPIAPPPTQRTLAATGGRLPRTVSPRQTLPPRPALSLPPLCNADDLCP